MKEINLYKFFKKHEDLIYICLLLLFLFLYKFWSNPIRPGVVYEKGWYGWNDQAIYYNMAESISNGQMDSRIYNAGFGYPLVAVIFFKIFPKDPFLIPDIILYISTNILWYLIAKKIFSTKEEAFFSILLLNLATPFPDYFVIPWSTIIPTFCLSLICYLILKDKPNYRETAIMGLMVGWMFSARYLDAFFGLPIVFFGLYHYQKQRISFNLKKHIAIFLVVLLLIVGVTLYTHQLYFGSYFKTPYDKHLRPGTGASVQDIDTFVISRIPDAFNALIVNPYYLLASNTDKPLLGHAPFFILFLTGILFAIYKFKDKMLFFISISISILLLSVFYLSSISFNADSLRFHVLRVYILFFPIFTIMSFLAFLTLFKYSEQSNNEKKKINAGLAITAIIVLIPAVSFILNPYPIPADISMTIDKQNYSVGDRIDVMVILKDTKGNGVNGMDVRSSYSINGERKQYKLYLKNKENGIYYDSFIPERPGVYKLLSVYVEMPQKVPEITIKVQNKSNTS